MKALIISITLSMLLALGAVNAYGLSKNEIKIAARQASVQPSFFIPIIKAYFATIPEEKEQTREALKAEMAELMEKRIKEEIKKAADDASESRYLTTLTTIEQYGVRGKSRQEIALGAIVPEHARFPEKVLVVKKVKTENITAWEKEYEKDVLTISETTGVSLSKAKDMLTSLLAAGYQITKDTEEPDAEVVLLHFSGWDDVYPTTLQWEVRIDGGPNLIRGYDPRGILIVQTLPEDQNGEIQRAYVKAGFFDLKKRFRDKPYTEITLEREKKELEEKIKTLEKKLKKKEEKGPVKRDITNATMYDVMYGYVILERYYARTGASGVYLGNMKASSEMSGYSWGNYHVLNSEYKGIVLTNSHVVSYIYGLGMYVSKDKQTMWIILPAHSYIRYTQNSDTFGSPAHLLVIDGVPVDSYDNDCAILMTSPIPGYEKYAAKLGDSDLVEEGLEVVAVGSPMMIQKQLTEGIISNTNYSLLKSPLADSWLSSGISRRAYEWVAASSFWVDTTQGAGGSSGSPVIALEGSQKGRVVALRNMGIVSRHTIAKPLAKQTLSPAYLTEKIGNGPLRIVLPANKDLLFQDFSYKSAVYSVDAEEIAGEDETLETILQSGSKQDVAGLNGCVPINNIKSFLAERGLDLEKFGTKRLSGKYWTK